MTYPKAIILKMIETLDISFEDDPRDIWLSQADFAKLFNVSSQTISRHIKHIYKDRKLSEKQTCTSNVLVHLKVQGMLCAE